MGNSHGVRLGVLAGAIALATATAAVQAAPQQIEEVVVTAQKHEQGINDVGITINAFTGDQLKAMRVKTAEDIALHTPGLTVNSTAALGVPVYTIRGVGFQDYNAASSSTVGLYFDEVSLPYAVMTRGAVFDVERVEVLKGPQGDLYGRNTTAGSINFISKKPTEDFEAGFSTSYGRYETFDLEGWASGALTDGVQGRLAFKTTQSGEGWQKSLTRDDELGEQDIGAVRGLLNFDLGEKATLLLNAHYVKDQSENTTSTAYDAREIGIAEAQAPYSPLVDYRLTNGAHFGETPPWYSTGDNEAADWNNTVTTFRNGVAETVDIRPQRDNELKGFSARLDWELTDGITLTSITGYDDFERVEASDGDGGAYNDSGEINTSDIEVFSQELRLSGKTDKVLWIAGLFYSKDSADEWYNYFMRDSIYGGGSVAYMNLYDPAKDGPVDPRAGLFAANPINELDTIYSQDTESYAAYGHVEYNFTEQLRGTVGLRYTDETRDWEGCTYDVGDGSLSGFLNANFGTTLAPGDCGTVDDIPSSPTYFFTLLSTGQNPNLAFLPYEESIDTQKWQWKLGLDYAFTDDVLAYATVSTGFKSGGFNGANSNSKSQLIPYKEEELTSYEVGVKSTLLDGAMQLNAAAFYYDYQDKQEQDLAVTFVGNISGLTNVPESEVVGFETELRWMPVDGLNIDMGVAWLDTEVKEWDAVDPDPSKTYFDIATSTAVISYIDVSGSELAMSPEWQYNTTVSYEWNLSDGLVMSIAGDIAYKDETSAQLVEQAIDDYTVMNARISLGSADAKWRAILWSNNIADEDYYVAGYVGNGPYSRVNGMPRTYGVTLDYNF